MLYFKAILRHPTDWACLSKGRIVSASGQIFRSEFRPGMPFRPLDEQAHCAFSIKFLLHTVQFLFSYQPVLESRLTQLSLLIFKTILNFQANE